MPEHTPNTPEAPAVVTADDAAFIAASFTEPDDPAVSDDGLLTDGAAMKAALKVWNALFAVRRGRVNAVVGFVASWLADRLDLNERDLGRKALHALVQSWTAGIKGPVKRALDNMIQDLGGVYPVTDAAEQERLGTFQRLCVSEISKHVNAAGNVRVTLKRKDKNGKVSVRDFAFDLSNLAWSEELFLRARNVAAAYVPPRRPDVLTPAEQIASVWAV